MDAAGATHDVRLRGIRTYKGKKATTYTVRWSLAGDTKQRTFANRKLADAFRSELAVAINAGSAFSLATGLPVGHHRRGDVAWLDHAMDYVLIKWPMASPRYRKGIAEALTDITLALLSHPHPDPGQARQALNQWAFNGQAQTEPPPADLEPAVRWLQRNSPPVVSLTDPRRLRQVLHALSLTQQGAAAAPATFARKRATLNNVLSYAVELDLIQEHPLTRIRVQRQRHSAAVDRRVVVNPDQARALLAAVWENDPSLGAFFACMYFAGLRPAEVRNLRVTDLELPSEGWGSALLTGSHQFSGSRWTDTGVADEERALKHRGSTETRSVPLHPELVDHFRRHLDQFPLGEQGRLFVSRTGRAGVPITPPYQRPVAMGSVYRAWHRAREEALTAEQAESMLARRPYDLRHACLSTWLNSGVPPAQVAAWAGHGVDVLLRVYAKCIDGEEDAARRRIEEAVAPQISPRFPPNQR